MPSIHIDAKFRTLSLTMFNQYRVLSPKLSRIFRFCSDFNLIFEGQVSVPTLCRIIFQMSSLPTYNLPSNSHLPGALVLSPLHLSLDSEETNMQCLIEESPLHGQAGDFIPNRKIIEDTSQPQQDLSRELSIDLPAHYDLDKKYTTSSSEIWSYYLYFVGNSGASSLYFAPIAFQSLLSEAAGDAGVLRFAGR